VSAYLGTESSLVEINRPNFSSAFRFHDAYAYFYNYIGVSDLSTAMSGDQATAVESSGISTDAMVGKPWTGTRARIWRILVALRMALWLPEKEGTLTYYLGRIQGTNLVYRNIEPWTNPLL
jgi:hypothetical protein